MALIRYKYNGKEEVSTDITVDTTVSMSRFQQNSGDVRIIIDVVGDAKGKRSIGEDVYITLTDNEASYLSLKSNSTGEFFITDIDTTSGILNGSFEIVYKLDSGDKLIKNCKFES